MTWLIAICIALSLATSLVLVPVVRSLAHLVGVVDRPDADRKLHDRPVALGGGLAVFAALVVAFVGTILIDRQFFSRTLGDISTHWYVLFGAAGAMLMVGLIDDAWNLRGRQKLLLQCLIIVVLVGSGTVVTQISVLGFDLNLGVFAFPVTVLWLLIAVNALNLIDGADGMATTAGCIICLGLGFFGLQMGSSFSAVVGFALAAALFGFLFFNLPPASIYLGDAGSMMIGLFVGALAVWSNFKESAVLASAPIAILAIPLFDSTAAVLRRWLTGRSIYVTDRAHLHHLLQEKYGSKRMLLLVAVLCAITTTSSIFSARWNQPWLAAVGVLIVLALLVMTRSFGHAEARLLMGRAAHFAQSFTLAPSTSDIEKQQRRVPLQGVGQWETIWEPLVEFAKTQELARVKIDLNLAWLHEGYHANWQSVRLPEKAFQLNISVPLFTTRISDDRQVQIGRLEIIARANDPGVYERIGDLSDQLSDLGPEIDRIVGNLEARKQRASDAAAGSMRAMEATDLPEAESESEIESVSTNA